MELFMDKRENCPLKIQAWDFKNGNNSGYWQQ
jgi:hypothetical protein